MSITKKLMSFSLALFIALGVLVCPLFANKSKADTRVAYSGIGVIDDFLNDPRWSDEYRDVGICELQELDERDDSRQRDEH